MRELIVTLINHNYKILLNLSTLLQIVENQ